MIIITAGAYVGGELRSEFGEIPPVLLPVGNRPLLRLQLAALGRTFPDEDVVLSLPEGFVPTAWEQRFLLEASLQVVWVPEGLTLGQSVLYSLNLSGRFAEPTRILHGDTLFQELPAALDLVSVGETSDNYTWQPAQDGSVWSGYFAFAETRLLIQCLTRHGDFAQAVLAYGRERPLHLFPSPDWQDLGHLNTYFDARTRYTTQRSFNSLTMADGVVVKGGDAPEKIAAEARWFEQLPLRARTMTPAYYGMDLSRGTAYVLEYLPMVPLNEIFVHGRQGTEFWDYVFGMHAAWFDMAASHPSADVADDLASLRRSLTVDKTWQRLERYCEDAGIDAERPVRVNGHEFPGLSGIARDCIRLASDHQPVAGLMHGDLCFSNTVHDARNRRLRFFDPRGVDDDRRGLVGDLRYDLSKLAHSVVGLYDFIVAGKFTATLQAPYEWHFEVHAPPECEQIGSHFLGTTFPGFTEPAMSAIPETILLFLSMLPLHADDPRRQLGLMLNAFRLYQGFVRPR